MKVVIQVGGKFHAVNLAVELHRRGVLERILTTKGWYVRSVLPEEKWTALPAAELFGMLVRKVGWLRERGYYSYVKDNLFDALARRALPPCDVFHAWGNYALASMAVVRRYGASVVIERGSTHPHYQDAILREEFERFSVPVSRAHPQIIAKGLEEMEKADAVVIPSEFVRRSFLAQGFPEEKLQLIPYGADLERFRAEEGDKLDPIFRVLFVGNVGIQKGVHYLLEAWKRCAFPDAELLFVGRVDEGMAPVLRRYEGLFRHIPHIPHEKLPPIYRQASLFVLPSLQEGSALVTYEAMACGLPVLVSENTGSVARDGKDGWVVPIRDTEALVERLHWAREHREELTAMGRSARDHVGQYTWSRYADRVMDLYHRLRGV